LRRKFAVAAAVVVAALPATAFGATVSVDVIGGVTYTAAPGELNVVELSELAGTVSITDTGAVINAGNGCNQVSAHEVTCSGVTHNPGIRLGDLGDTASLVAADSAFFTLVGQGGKDHLTLCAHCHGLLVGDSGGDSFKAGT
jgi:hypothetical protein